jgi:hypothetical protein
MRAGVRTRDGNLDFALAMRARQREAFVDAPEPNIVSA